MASLVDAFENELLDGLTGVTPLTTPTTVYLAVFSADPTDTGSVTDELSGNGYARKSLSGLFSAATGTGGSVSNTSAVDFVTATGDWLEATHVGYMKSGTAGTDDMMVGRVIVSPITILDGEALSFGVGKLTLIAD